ncbi:MAG TPA: NUDIX hydrolase [Actinomycetota bacterium]
MEPARTERAFEGRFLRVDVEVWTDPERRREIVRHPGAAAVVARDPGGRVILVRQVREAVRQRLLEIPAGVFDVEGESPEDTARRELLEETGFRARTLERLGAIVTSPGFSDERIELYLADAEPAGRPEEGLEVVTLALDEALEAIDRGEITDAKTVAGLLMAARRG